MSSNVFVISDFSAEGLDPILQALAERPPSGFRVTFGNQTGGGEILRNIVFKRLCEADKALVFVDQANANVGFELGVAAAWKKPFALVRYNERLPEWLDYTPLKNFLVNQVKGPDEIRKAFADERLWFSAYPIGSAVDCATSTLFLCPKQFEGQAYLENAQKYGEWKFVDPANIGLDKLGALCADVANTIWTVLPYRGRPEERDGAENAANAIVAGWFFGLRLCDD
jgi:hypothetical protein